MLEVIDSSLAQYVMHYVGDTTVFAEEVYTQPNIVLQAAFTQLAFSKLDLEQQYEFFHETNIDLNEVYTYAQAIFSDRRNFLTQSKYMATHLKSVSNHPNIKDGELFIGLFDNCLWRNEAKSVLAIVKIDEKEIFLDVKNEQDKMTVSGIDGINVKRINNIVVIVDMGADEAPIVFMKAKKKEDVVYWQERFLKLKVSDENFHKTNLALTECKKYILKEEEFSNTDKLQYLNKTLDYFRAEEKFQVNDYIETVFEKVEDAQRDVLVQSVKPYETVISESAIAKAEKSYKRKIKLDDSIEIQVNVRDIEEVNKLIEVGYDEVTKRKFYKIYFEEEL